MRKLANIIAKELERASHCAVYEKELCRMWPLDQNEREATIRKFAEEHGWRLRFYKEGLCALFGRESPPPSERL